jgi:hypothetical protein
MVALVALDARDDGVWLKVVCCLLFWMNGRPVVSWAPRPLIEICVIVAG